MATPSTAPEIRAEAETQTVEDLVDLVLRGQIRIPAFQRPLRWEAKEVVSLFDSVYHGYPIGSLLLSKGSAPAGRVKLGPVEIDAPESTNAFWVVDGQQRLTALTAGLARTGALPREPIDPFVVYFDAAEQKFRSPSRELVVRSEWVPATQLLDAASLSEWVHNWKFGQSSVMRSAVFQAGARIRSYKVPLYVVETVDSDLLRDIFFRINNSGKALLWPEVHDALFGHTGAHPSTLSELALELESLGMGRPEKEYLFTCLVAFRGLDPTRSFSEHYQKDPAVFRDTVAEALPALRAAMSFLRRYALIPHLRLLPRLLPLVVLTRAFGRFSDPSPRTLELLRRWVWRAILGADSFDERTTLRHAVTALARGEEEDCIQKLLPLVPKQVFKPYVLSQRFDARGADSRIALVALAALQPQASNGSLIDVSLLIESEDAGAFKKIVRSDMPHARSAANRIFLPAGVNSRAELECNAENLSFLHSHCVTSQAVSFLVASNTAEFLASRAAAIELEVNRLGNSLAAWEKSDRPSIRHLLEG